MTGFRELVVGDVLVAPFVGYAGAAFVLFLILRRSLRFVGFERLFSNVPVAELSLFVIILALLFALS